MRTLRATLTAISAIALLAVTALASPAGAQLVKIENAGDALVFHPVQEAKAFFLTVTGPCNYEYRSRIDKGEIVFKLSDEAFDGAYSFSIDATPVVSAELMDVLHRARATGNVKQVRELCRDGKLPTGPTSQSGSFSVVERKVVLDTTPESKRGKRDEGTKRSKKSSQFSAEPRDTTTAELANDFRDALDRDRPAYADSVAPTVSPEECVWARIDSAAGVAER